MRIKIVLIVTQIVVLFLFISCVFYHKNHKNKDDYLQERDSIIAILNEDEILEHEIDSIIGFKIYRLKIEALEMLLGKKILEAEALKRNIKLHILVENEINSKCKTVTSEDVENYITYTHILTVDTNNIKKYLFQIFQKERQKFFIDSLKQYHSIKIKLKPPFYNIIKTSELYSNDLTKINTKMEVFILSDFNCPSCQQAEETLQNLYNKYNNKVNFKFVYFSDYIDKDALACEAAAKQNKFRQMHDIIFENTELLHQDSIYHDFANKLYLDLDEFRKDIEDNQILKRLLQNRDLLISNEIYSIPTYIVNGKVLDDKYAIDYLEDVIIEEFNLKN